MAMNKFLASLILALIAISMLQTLVMASNDSHLYDNKGKYGPGSLKSYRYYGNKAVCPCYNNWKTQQGGPKCP
ncbi:gibberellin-regulated protein 4-like [Trifolium pratense]|uniref:Gibberellin-regulated protein 4-like n=1 Tax=Trifolium pratense TaxID=57577 RepID=A0A2K3NWX7_TRIPR|nr:gibberellin-regulated protein 4-like [Trifolium pratense]